MKKLFVLLALCAAAVTTEAKNIYRGYDPNWQSQPSWYDLTPLGEQARFQFMPGSIYAFAYSYNGRELWATGFFTDKSIVNYKRGTVTLMVGSGVNGRPRYICVKRINVQFID